MKIEALVELVRTLAESFQQLSGLVEGMPKVVDNKLAVIRNAWIEETSLLRREFVTLRTEFGDLQSDTGAMRALFHMSTAAVRENSAKIIADNREETDTRLQTLSERIANVGEALDQTRLETERGFASVREEIKTAMEATTKEFEAQHAFISNVRTACDTTDLHHGIKKLEHAVATGEEGHLQLVAKVDETIGALTVGLASTDSFVKELATVIGDNEKMTIQLVERVEKRVGEVEGKVDTVDKAHLQSWSQLSEKATAEIGEVRSGLSELGVDVATAKDALRLVTEDVTRVAGELRQAVADVASHAGEARSALDALVSKVDGFGMAQTSLTERLEAVVQREVVSPPMLTEAVDKVQQTIATIEDGIRQQITRSMVDVSCRFEGVETVLSAVEPRIVGLENVKLPTHEDVQRAVFAVQGEFSERVANVVVDLSSRIEHVETKFADIGSTIAQRVQALESTPCGPTAEDVQQAVRSVHDEFSENLARVSVGVSNRLANTETTLAGLVDSGAIIAQRVQALESAPRGVTPEDLHEKHTELLNSFDVRVAAGNINLSGRIEAVEIAVGRIAEAAPEIEQRFKALEEVNALELPEVQRLLTTFGEEVVTPQVSELAVRLAAHRDDLSRRIEAVARSVSELPAPVPPDVTRADVTEMVGKLEQQTGEGLANVQVKFGQQVDVLTFRVDEIIGGIAKAPFVLAINEQVRELSETLEAQAQLLEIRPTLDVVKKLVAENTDDMENRVASAIVESNAAREALAEFRQTVPTRDEISTIVASMAPQKHLDMACQGINTRISDIAVNVQALAETVRDLPAPPAAFDPEPLKSWVSEQLETRKLDLNFDVGVNEDRTMVFTFGVNGAEVVREVPLGIGIEYRGVYDRETEYAIGNFVTHRGSMWYAKATPTGEPGKDLEGWQLAVKCGRDGKDAPTPSKIKHVRDPNTNAFVESRLVYDDDQQQPPNQE